MHYEHDIIKGLFVIPNYLTDTQSDQAINHIKKCQWMPVSNTLKSRKVIHYGWIYSYDRSGIKKTIELPECLSNLTNKMNEYLNKNIKFDQLIINKYEEGQAINAHIDHTKFFGDTILCLTLMNSVTAIFSQGNIKIEVILEPLSAYIMTNDARYKWTHEMKQSHGTRISLTYRTIIDK